MNPLSIDLAILTEKLRQASQEGLSAIELRQIDRAYFELGVELEVAKVWESSS